MSSSTSSLMTYTLNYKLSLHRTDTPHTTVGYSIGRSLDPMNGRSIGCILAARALPGGLLLGLLLRAGPLARGAPRAGAPAAGQDASELASDGEETFEPAACRLRRSSRGAARARARAALARGGRRGREVVGRIGASGKALQEGLALQSGSQHVGGGALARCGA